MKNKLILIFASLFLAVLLCGTSAAAVNETTPLAEEDVCVADPIINGTININEYGNVRPLEGATVIVNSSNRILATATTDANGYYTMAFYSNQTVFNVTASYMGCNPVTHSVTVTPGISPDPNYYGTSNFTLTPKNATVISTGSGTNVYIKYSGQYSFAGVINVRVDGVTYRAFCIDLYTPIAIGDYLLVNGPLPGTAGDLSPDIDWAKVNYIINNYNPSTNLEAAAMQSAIWYFTSAHYGTYPGNNPNGYYQFMTYNSSYGTPYDGYSSSTINYSRHTVANRAWEIINAAQEMQYPYQVTLTPETIRVPNGSPVTLNAQVTDFDGNPLSGIRVNFTTNQGTLSSSFGFTDLNGMVTTVLSGLSTSTAMVSASVNGTYGTLLYDDVNNRKQNMVALNVLPYTMSDTSIINYDVTALAQLSQQVTSPVNVGDSVTYTVNVTNNGPNTATGIMIENHIPQNLGNATVQISTGTYYQGIWVIPSLAQGESATLTISGTATVDMAGKNTTNTATRIAQDQYNSEPLSVSAAAYTKMADVQLSQTGNTPVNVGDEVTYVVTAQNIGPDNATNFIIENKIPEGLLNVVVTPSTGSYLNGNWTVPFLANGDFATLTITGIASADMAGKNTTNTATKIFETEYDPTTIGESVTFDVYTKKANVVLSQTGNYVKDVVTFLVTATNNGPDAATNINIENLIPAGLTNVLVTPNVGTYDISTGMWNIPVLANGAVAVLNITGRAVPQSTVNNAATLINQTEFNEKTEIKNENSIYVPSSDLRVNNYIYNGPNLPTPYGSSVIYTVVAINNPTYNVSGVTYQSDDATGVFVSIILPEGLEFVAASPRQGNFNGDSLIWNIGGLPRGGYAYLDLMLKVIGYDSVNLTLTNNALISGDQFDPILSNNERPYSITVRPPADVEVNYVSSNEFPVVGDGVSLMVSVVNNGPVDASGVRVTNQLPDGLSYVNHEVSWDGGVSWIGADSSYNPISGLWDLSGRTIGDGEVYLLRINAMVTKSGKIVTEARKSAQSSTQLDYNLSNNSKKITLNVDSNEPIVPSSDLRVNNYIYNGPNLPTPYGSSVIYTVVAINNPTYNVSGVTYQSDDATGVFVSIILPEGLEFVAASPRQGNFIGEFFVWNIGDLARGGYAYLDLMLKVIGSDVNNLTVINTAIISGDQFDPILSNNERSASITVRPPADVEVNYVSSNESPVVGDGVSLMVSVVNNGPVDASGVRVTNQLPDGLSYVNHEVSWDGGVSWIGADSSYNPISGLWDLSGRTIGDGEVYLLRINAMVTKSGKIVTEARKSAQSSTQLDYNLSNNSRKLILNVRD